MLQVMQTVLSNVWIQAWGPNYYVLHNRALEVQGIHQPF